MRIMQIRSSIRMWTHLKKFDWVLVATVLVLCAVSQLVLYSIDQGNGGTNYFHRQFFYLLAGLAAMIFLGFLDFRIFKNYSLILLILYFLLIAALVLVLFFGAKIRGTIGWFNLGAINFEPVELAKLVILLILAKYFSGRHVEMYRPRHLLISALYVLAPIFLILLQPDLGSALILAAIWLAVALLSEIKKRHLLFLALGASLVFVVAWFFMLAPYQKARISSVFNSARDPLNSSYNLIQSKIAVGSGGLWGKGLGQGTQGQLNFLPEKHTDFIFAVFAEEWGFLGVIFLLAFFALFFWRLIRAALRSSNNFSKLFVSGFAAMIFIEVFINIGMNMGLVPIAGISLPFLSYGGSNLLINFAGLGIIQNIISESGSSAFFKKEE